MFTRGPLYEEKHCGRGSGEAHTSDRKTYPPFPLGPVGLHLFADVVVNIMCQGSITRDPVEHAREVSSDIHAIKGEYEG